MLTDPGVIAGGGLLGLGAVLSRQLAKGAGRRGLGHAMNRFGRLRPGADPQWANLTEETLHRGLQKLGVEDIPRPSSVEDILLSAPRHGEDVGVYEALRAGSPGSEVDFGQALERIVQELEPASKSHAMSSRGWPKARLRARPTERQFRTATKLHELAAMKAQPRIYSTRELAGVSEEGVLDRAIPGRSPTVTRKWQGIREKGWPYISEQMGRELSPEARMAQESRIDSAATIESVRDLIAEAKAGNRESLELLLGRFGNGFGSGPEHDAIIPYRGHGAESANDVKAVLSIRKEINSVLYDAGLIDESMTIHEAVLQRRPTIAQQSSPMDPEYASPEDFLGDFEATLDPQIWSGSRSRDILEELSPLDLNVHTYEGQLPAERIGPENRPDLG